MPDYWLKLKAETDGDDIFCPRCGKRADIKAYLFDYSFSNFLSCPCTDKNFLIGRRRGNRFSISTSVSDFDIAIARVECGDANG